MSELRRKKYFVEQEVPNVRPKIHLQVRDEKSSQYEATQNYIIKLNFENVYRIYGTTAHRPTPPSLTTNNKNDAEWWYSTNHPFDSL